MSNDLQNLNSQIEDIKKRQTEELLTAMAEQNAKIEEMRLKNELKRIENDRLAKEKEEYWIKIRQQEKEAQEAADRAKRDAQIAEERRLNAIQEAKDAEQAEAEAMAKRVNDLQFAHEQALQRLKDSFAMSLAANQSKETTDEVAKDGTEPKPVAANENGSVNPLRHFVQSSN